MSWLFPAYIAAVIGGLAWHKRYRRRHPADPPKTIHGKILLGLGKAGVALSIFYIGIMVMLISFIVYDYYLFFTPSRIDYVEERTGIIIGDEVKPVKFVRMFGGMDAGSAFRLTLRTDLDSDGFMEKCCKGEIIQRTENGVIYDTDGRSYGPAESSGGPDCKAYYLYKYDDRNFSVLFKKDGTVLIRR